MAAKTEYLVKRYDRDATVLEEIRAPKGVSIEMLLERLICRNLDTEALIASCLRKNAKRAYDPFQIIDMRDDYRREQAKAALQADPDTSNPIGVFNSAWAAPIPLGKTLLFAGVGHEFSVSEVEVRLARRKRYEGQTR